MESTEITHQRTVQLKTMEAFELGQGQRVSLVIYHRDGIEAVPLEEGHGVVIGRAHPASVCIAHPSLSRQHARFEIVDKEIWVEDLGSTNGTVVEGGRITRRSVTTGQDVVLGDVTVSVHAVTPADRFLPGLLSHDRFMAALEEEMVRQRLFSRRLGVALVQSEGRKRGELSQWVPRVRELLRPVDRMALYSPSAVEILVPEATAETMVELAGAICGSRQIDEPALRCGLALFPDAATSAEALLEATRTAAIDTGDEAFKLFSSSTLPVPAVDAATDETVVQSAAMKKVFSSVDRLAKATIPVLIVGETGAGKEVVARAIHERSKRREKPLRCINCAAIPGQLLESIMFGHEKGAFTGADRRTKGIFQEAEGGAVLLDEVGELSPEAQATLLRVLETKKVMRVGSNEEIDVDVRVIAATHRDLEAMCEAGTFRQDLLYRINAITLKVPPLRERPEEVTALARRFLHEANAANECQVTGLDPEVLAILAGYSWPGNVRELRNVIHRAVVLAEGETVTIDDLPERVLAHEGGGQSIAPLLEEREPSGSEAAEEELDFRERVQRFEAGLISEALKRARGNKSEAARLLRIPIRTLTNKVRALGIDV